MSSHRAPDLVLLHGWGMNAAVWGDLPVALSQIGAGPVSPHRAARPRRPTPAADRHGPRRLGRCCLEQAPARAVWLGWSLGGLVALSAALQAPERVAGLILTHRHAALRPSPGVAGGHGRRRPWSSSTPACWPNPPSPWTASWPPGARQRHRPGDPARPAPRAGQAPDPGPGRPGPRARSVARWGSAPTTWQP